MSLFEEQVYREAVSWFRMTKKPKKHACDDRTDQLNDFIFDGIQINDNDLIAFGERFTNSPFQTDDVGQELQIAYSRTNVSSFVT